MNSAESQKPERELDSKLLRQLQHAACVAGLCPGVTHKLNNALAGTLSNLELVVMEESLPPEILASHKWSQQAAWQAADLNRAFVEFITHNDAATGPVDVDGLLSQVVQFFRRFSDLRVDISHTPSSQRIYSRVNSAVLTDNLVALALLGQRRLPGGGSIKFSASQEAARVTITVALDASAPTPGFVHPESPLLLEWLCRSLAVTAEATLETTMREERPVGFLLHLPGAL